MTPAPIEAPPARGQAPAPRGASPASGPGGSTTGRATGRSVGCTMASRAARARDLGPIMPTPPSSLLQTAHGDLERIVALDAAGGAEPEGNRGSNLVRDVKGRISSWLKLS